MGETKQPSIAAKIVLHFVESWDEGRTPNVCDFAERTGILVEDALVVCKEAYAADLIDLSDSGYLFVKGELSRDK